MKIFLLILLLLCVENDYSQVYESVSPTQQISMRKKPLYPPKLTVGVSFSEPNGNGYLDAEETGTIYIKIKNDGNGNAVNFKISMEPYQFENLKFSNPDVIQSIPPGDEKKIEIPITAGFSVQSQDIGITINFKEEFGFEPDPVKLNFKTKKFQEPNLILIEGLGIDDANGNGMIEPGW